MTAPTGPLLTVNAGSATVKLDVFDFEQASPKRRFRRTLGIDAGDPAALIGAFIAEAACGPPSFVAHRIVHGGRSLNSAAIIDQDVESAILAATPLAPLHNPAGLAWVEASRTAAPKAKQIAVPDTGFFAALPARAARYALPRSLSDELDLRRYGFHGIAQPVSKIRS